jgi:hypothetical protein
MSSTMPKELKNEYMGRISELLDLPVRDLKVQINYHYDEVPLLRYDVTEYIKPKEDGEKIGGHGC